MELGCFARGHDLVMQPQQAYGGGVTAVEAVIAFCVYPGRECGSI